MRFNKIFATAIGGLAGIALVAATGCALTGHGNDNASAGPYVSVQGTAGGLTAQLASDGIWYTGYGEARGAGCDHKVDGRILTQVNQSFAAFPWNNSQRPNVANFDKTTKRWTTTVDTSGDGFVSGGFTGCPSCAIGIGLTCGGAGCGGTLFADVTDWHIFGPGIPGGMATENGFCNPYNVTNNSQDVLTELGALSAIRLDKLAQILDTSTPLVTQTDDGLIGLDGKGEITDMAVANPVLSDSPLRVDITEIGINGVAIDTGSLHITIPNPAAALAAFTFDGTQPVLAGVFADLADALEDALLSGAEVDGYIELNNAVVVTMDELTAGGLTLGFSRDSIRNMRERAWR
jgi:hypothetical protein